MTLYVIDEPVDLEDLGARRATPVDLANELATLEATFIVVSSWSREHYLDSDAYPDGSLVVVWRAGELAPS